MSSKLPEFTQPYSEFYRFSAGGIMKAPNHLGGVYTIYAKQNCLYVGKTEDQSLQKRLFDHYKNCHNSRLKNWILSHISLRFRFVVVSEVSKIDDLEKVLIKKLNPCCNIRRS